MSEQEQKRSSLQSGAALANKVRAAYHIIRAAELAGLPGFAAAAAKEALPVLVKLAVGILVVLLIVPMVVFAAVPNFFFGYFSSEAEPIVQMTDKAMSIGGVYLSMEDMEGTLIDSVVTGIVSECENEGTQIDEIEVDVKFDEDDLCWLIAISSVAYQQDLNAMTAEAVRSFCTARLKLTPSLTAMAEGEGLVKTALKVTVEKLEPDALMEALDFDEDARTWAGALYETLNESDALTAYADHYEAYRPDYSGDNSYMGGILHGTDYDNGIDISAFVSPDTKNNLDLAAYAIQAWENNWGYVWGTFGNVLTPSLFEYKLRQYPDGVGNYEAFIRANWLGRRTADCVGLIKGYGWLDASDASIRYGTNGMPDYGADQMYRSAAEKGPISTMPDIVGLAVWKQGHIGVYIGGGYVIEAMGTKYGVVKTELEDRGWTGWCKLPGIDYMED